jgi:hypothetical protein
LGDSGFKAHIFLLMYAAEARPDGVLSDLDADDIALAADWRGDPQEFVDTLTALKLLDFDGQDYAIHDWHTNNPWAAGATARSEKARKAANTRHHGKSTPSTNNQTVTPKKDAPSTDKQCHEHDTALQEAKVSNAPFLSVSLPSPIQDQESGASAPSPPAKRKTRFPHEALPDDWAGYCRDKRPDLDPQTVFENCRDYYLAHGKPMQDWLRCWQRWVRNEKPGKPSVTGHNGQAHISILETWKPPSGLVDELTRQYGRGVVDAALTSEYTNERQFRTQLRILAQ